MRCKAKRAATLPRAQTDRGRRSTTREGYIKHRVHTDGTSAPQQVWTTLRPAEARRASVQPATSDQDLPYTSADLPSPRVMGSWRTRCHARGPLSRCGFDSRHYSGAPPGRHASASDLSVRPPALPACLSSLPRQCFGSCAAARKSTQTHTHGRTGTQNRVCPVSDRAGLRSIWDSLSVRSRGRGFRDAFCVASGIVSQCFRVPRPGASSLPTPTSASQLVDRGAPSSLLPYIRHESITSGSAARTHARHSRSSDPFLPYQTPPGVFSSSIATSSVAFDSRIILSTSLRAFSSAATF